MSIFVPFLVFELLSILYSTKVNSDQGLGQAFGREAVYRGFAKYAVDANLFRPGR